MTDNTDDAKPAEPDDILARIPGTADAANRIRDEATYHALRELLQTAIKLRLQLQHIRLGKKTGFAFGPRRYPLYRVNAADCGVADPVVDLLFSGAALCRVNAAKGIAFHGHRYDKAPIIHAADDHAFRLTTGILRRLSLSMALNG